VLLAEEVRDGQDGEPEHHEAEMPRPAGQLELANGNLGTEVLEQAERAGPPAKQTTGQRADHDEHADSHEGNQM
jgi:hypothetical protein